MTRGVSLLDRSAPGRATSSDLPPESEAFTTAGSPKLGFSRARPGYQFPIRSCIVLHERLGRLRRVEPPRYFRVEVKLNPIRRRERLSSVMNRFHADLECRAYPVQVRRVWMRRGFDGPAEIVPSSVKVQSRGHSPVIRKLERLSDVDPEFIKQSSDERRIGLVLD